MRLNITNSNPFILDFVKEYFNHNLLNKEVEAIINGVKYAGEIKEPITYYNKKPYYVFELKIGDKTEEIPILVDKTKIRIGKTLFFLETEKHATVIEIVD